MQDMVREKLAAINAAHTQENLERLRSEYLKHGGKLTGSLRSKSGFTARFAHGVAISGITLADADHLLNGVMKPKID